MKCHFDDFVAHACARQKDKSHQIAPFLQKLKLSCRREKGKGGPLDDLDFILRLDR